MSKKNIMLQPNWNMILIEKIQGLKKDETPGEKHGYKHKYEKKNNIAIIVIILR